MSEIETYTALDSITQGDRAERLRSWERERSEDEISSLLGRRAALLSDFVDLEIDSLAA